MFFNYRDMLDNRDKFKINIEICLTLSSHTSSADLMKLAIDKIFNAEKGFKTYWGTMIN